MNTLRYLYKNRERPITLKRGLVLLAKRTLMLMPLIRILRKQRKLIKKGARVGSLSIIGQAKIEGRDLSGLFIGEQTSIGSAEITLHDKVTIGNNVVMNDGVVLLTGSHRLSDPEWSLKTSPIIIKDFVWLATNAIILPGVTIGKGAVVGAGSVVREDVPDFAIVFGNPAKIIEGRQRIKDLDYSPVFFNAPYEAWVGKK